VQELAQYVPQAAPRRVGAPPMGDARMPMAARATPMAASPAGTGGVKKTIAGMGPEPRGRSAVEDKNTPIPLSELASAAAGLSHGADENGQQRRGAGEYDLFVGEASQMVQISQIPGMPKAGITPVPIVRSTPINGSGAAIGRGTSPGPATPLPMPPATATSTGAARLIAPPKKKKSYLGVILVCCFAAAAILGVILFLGFRQRAGVNEDDVAGDPSGAGGSEVIDNFYKGGGGLPGTSAPAGTPAAPGAEAAAAPDKSPVRRPGIRATNPTQAPRPLGGGGKPDLFSDDDDPQQVTVDDILEKGKIANPGMKQCYNRALKNDPMLKLTRMDLRITVGTSGLVTEVKPLTNATKSQILTSCLVGIVKGWRFRKSREGLTADLPIIFSNG
jgi:hypothetical protein